jgi:hypothetical protein
MGKNTKKKRLEANVNWIPCFVFSEVPMNKVQVGFAPSPNLKTVHSKIGSLANANYKPGGGHVKIESKKIQIEAKPRIGARNENYTPSGGDVKVNIFFFKAHNWTFSFIQISQVPRVSTFLFVLATPPSGRLPTTTFSPQTIFLTQFEKHYYFTAY